MPLINCPECQNEVSDKAELCPKCGYGINDSLKKTITTQKTSKKLKAMQALGLFPMVVSFLFFFYGDLKTGLWIGGIGVAWVLIVNIKTWWEHG